jgi:tripartite-type tricarboxylate transporter receptor subunit TctC
METLMTRSSLFPRRAVAAAAVGLALAAASLVPSVASAQAYPSRPVTFIVPFAPGGGTDIGARLLAQKLGQKWGQSVVVENRTGAGGLVGAEAVVKSKPDGYTLFVGNVGTQSINPSLYKMPYNADTAFTPISLFADLPFVLVINPSIAAKTPKELIALAKAEPGKYTFASSGNGGSPHLTGEIFQGAGGVQLVHVPYKGGGPAMADLMAGHVNMLFASVLETSGYVKAGKLRALGVSSAQRSPALPDVPTLAEQGVANAESGSWIALLGPAGLPAAIVDKIAADVKEVLAGAEIREKLIAQGATPRGTTPAELQKIIDADRDRYATVIKARNVKAD